MKLEDVPKKNIFDVPDGYFEKLPGMIQARTSGSTTDLAPAWGLPVLRYALGVAGVVAVVASVWWWGGPQGSVEDQLGKIETTDLVAYLEEADMEAEELVDAISWTEVDSDELEEVVYEDILSTSAPEDEFWDGDELP